jgi:hypothetical protein
MKTKQWVAVSAAVLATCAVASLPCAAQGNSGNNSQSVFPAMPSGWLTAFPTIVQTGTHPTISWGINYPSVVEDYITITGSTITADEEVDCEIRVLGAGVTVTTNSSGGFNFVPTEATVSFNGGTYTRIFYGTNPQVNPNTVVYSKTIPKNRTLRFGGRYYYNNQWGTTYNSSHTHNVRTLVNGSTPPTNVPDYGAPSLEEFIKPYLTPDNKVKIGPMDAIVFMELTHTSSQMTNSGFDLQDMVLLVTFKSKAKTNNGHGNNIDGVDSSNPGNAPFINLDTDPEMDDEGGGGGAAPSDP